LISAKFSVNLINSYTVTSCKTMDRCLALSDALTTTQASIVSFTSFFYDVILLCRPLHVRNVLSFAYLFMAGFWGIWPPKCGRPSCRPQKGTSLRDCA